MCNVGNNGIFIGSQETHGHIQTEVQDTIENSSLNDFPVILTTFSALFLFNCYLGESAQAGAVSLTVLAFSINAEAPSLPAVQQCHAIKAKSGLWTKWGKNVHVCMCMGGGVWMRINGHPQGGSACHHCPLVLRRRKAWLKRGQSRCGDTASRS